MKLPEGAAFRLFNKHSIDHPNFVVVPQTPNKDHLNSFMREIESSFVLCDDDRLVVKANVPVGGKKKTGLVRIVHINELETALKEIFAIQVPQYEIKSVLVEEFVAHEEEFFVALKAVREGIEVYYSALGGIDVEANWGKVEKRLIDEELLVAQNWLEVEEKLFSLIAEKVVREWVVKLLVFFQEEDATYLEINPFTLKGQGERGKGKVMALGVVLVVDEAAEFRHPDWQTIVSELDEITIKTGRERHIGEIDSQIKGSVKLVEVPQIGVSGKGQRESELRRGGLTAVMGGGGATMFVCDAILENGYQLANYAEFSGNPPNFAVMELTKAVCSIPGIKNLVVGSGIANFTPVMGNFLGMIEGFKASPQAKKLNIVIRRCGPGEAEAMEVMKQFAKESGLNIKVFGREIPMTEVVKKF